jgi:serine/threonine protein kinase
VDTTPDDANAMSQQIGRFEIRRLLGEGTQSSVWLAFDPHLEREVAIKTLHFGAADPDRNERLLQEARTVSKLRHPAIVPIFEAGEENGDPYLVFEYVEGGTLAQFLAERGVPGPARAVELMLQVLEGIGHAHRFGIVHCDLKPSNILLDGSGARVMDFGIATRLAQGDAGDGALAGTPAYMAPETITQGIAGPQSDVYAAGLVLFELLYGRRAIAARGAAQAMEQAVAEGVVLPEAGEGGVDLRLQDVLAKATARDLGVRYASVEPMRDALRAWLDPGEAPEAGAERAAGTLEFLLRRMRHKSDFPALSEAISSINRLASSERENVSTLSNTILRDFALTNKILRTVNSAYFRTAGGGSISTVSRAIVVLGFETVRSIAVSLILFEHLQDKGHAAALKEEFLRANFGGMLARELAAHALRDTEEMFICAMFHNLGRMLSHYYFPEEAGEIRRRMQQSGGSEEAAAARVLGMGYEELGIGIARSWGFPERIVHSMRRMPAGAVRASETREERLRTLANFSDQISQAVKRSAAGERARELEKLRSRYKDAWPIADQELAACIEKAVAELEGLSASVRVKLAQTHFGRQLARERASADAEAAAAEANLPGTLPDAGAEVARETARARGGRGEVGAPAVDAQAILAAGIQDISNSLVDEFSLNDTLRIILETMYRALGFHRVLLCVREPRSAMMTGRFGFGPDAAEVARRFRFPLGGMADVFNIVLAKGVDLLVRDAAEPKILGHIPDWYRTAVGAPTFILLPLTMRSSPVGLIYADKAKPGAIVISEKELSLLRTLRNQAVLAIKQSS